MAQNFFSKISLSPPCNPFSYTMRIGDPFLLVIEEWPWIFSSVKCTYLRKYGTFPQQENFHSQKSLIWQWQGPQPGRQPFSSSKIPIWVLRSRKGKTGQRTGRFSLKYLSLISFLVGGWVDLLVVSLLALLVDWLVLCFLVSWWVSWSIVR